MNKSKIIKGLHQVVCDNGIDKVLDRHATSIATSLFAMLESMLWLNAQPRATLFEVNDAIEVEAKSRKAEEAAEIESFVEKMYKMYPTKCPKRNSSLGKSKRDKIRIKSLLKQYSPAEIERVIRHEIDSNYGINYMKNFSTFLNNFPDPNEAMTRDSDVPMSKTSDVVIINGQIYK